MGEEGNENGEEGRREGTREGRLSKNEGEPERMMRE
jgi:hypothetical protein